MLRATCRALCWVTQRTRRQLAGWRSAGSGSSTSALHARRAGCSGRARRRPPSRHLRLLWATPAMCSAARPSATVGFFSALPAAAEVVKSSRLARMRRVGWQVSWRRNIRHAVGQRQLLTTGCSCPRLKTRPVQGLDGECLWAPPLSVPSVLCFESQAWAGAGSDNVACCGRFHTAHQACLVPAHTARPQIEQTAGNSYTSPALQHAIKPARVL